MRFEKLTRAKMRALPAGAEIMENGIRYTKLANGDGRFALDLQVNRKRVHRVMGKESEGVSREDCEHAIEKLKTDAREDRLKLPKGRKVALLFEVAALEYLERLKEKGDAEYRTKKQRLEAHLIPFFKGKPLSDLAEWDIERYQSKRKREKVLNRDRFISIGTINRELSVLSHLLNCAVRWRWIEKVPCRITKQEEEEKKTVYLTPEQCKRLLNACKDHENKQLYPFTLIALSTGMRYSEVLRIKVEDIEFELNRIFLGKTKTGPQYQHIGSTLAEYLRSFCQDKDGWLFPTVGTRKSKTGHTIDLRRPFREAVESAGLDSKEIVRHTLRHTAVTHMVLAGVDLPTVKSISRHKTDSILFRYSHRNGEHIQTALDNLDFCTTPQDLRRVFSVNPKKLAPGRT